MAIPKEFTSKELLVLEAFDRTGFAEPTTRELSSLIPTMSVNGTSQVLTHLQNKKAVEYVSGNDGDKKWKKPSSRPSQPSEAVASTSE